MINRWKTEMKRAWHDVNLRREFEEITGMQPIPWLKSDVFQRQRDLGHLDAYKHCFEAWVTKKKGLYDYAPDEAKEYRFDKPKTPRRELKVYRKVLTP